MAPAQRKSATKECSSLAWGLRTSRKGNGEGNRNILVGHGGVGGAGDGLLVGMEVDGRLRSWWIRAHDTRYTKATRRRAGGQARSGQLRRQRK
jgi:hypothetical protein